MLNIVKNYDGENLTISLEGRLDTTTAPQAESELGGAAEGVSALVLDLAKLEYISSAGLRVFLSLQKKAAGKCGMKLINVNEAVMEIFEVTGFSDILDIE